MKPAGIYSIGAIAFIGALAFAWIDAPSSRWTMKAATRTALPQAMPAVGVRPDALADPAAGATNLALRPASQGQDPDSVIYLARAASTREERLDAIATLGQDRNARNALTLRSLLDDPDVAVREEAVEVLATLGGPGVIGGLAYALSDDNVLIRRLAIEGLAGDGRDAAVGALALVLHDENVGLRRLTVDELAEIDSDAARLALQQFVADPDAAVGERARNYLAALCGGRTDCRH